MEPGKKRGPRACALFGLGACVILTLAANAAMLPPIFGVLHFSRENPFGICNESVDYARAAYILVSFSLVVGLCVGREAYRQYAGTADGRESPLQLLLAVVAFPFVLLPLFWNDLWDAKRRANRLQRGLVYLLMAIIVFNLFQCTSSIPGNPSSDYLPLQILASLTACALGSWLTFSTVGAWDAKNKLEPPSPEPFRFSLRALMTMVMLLGLWGSGLVLLWRS